MYRMNERILILVVVLTLLAGSILPAAAQAPRNDHPTDPLTPVVLFPGYGGTRLTVSVRNQTIAPECPASGSFEYTYLGYPGPTYSQVCRDKLLTLVHQSLGVSVSLTPWVSEQQGVRVKIADYGKTQSAPLYESFFARLEQAGYVRNVNIRVAGNDFRLTPDMGGFLDRTIDLVEETYRQNNNTPVHLLGHSNGPFYALYLLTHTSQEWKDTYIHGFTAIAGNWPGQGGFYQFLFTGLNLSTGTFPTTTANAASSAAMYQSQPATYMTMADPAYFGNQEVVIRNGSTGQDYTPQDYAQLFDDAGLNLAQQLAPHYFGFVRFLPPYFPYVDAYAEKGSGIPTIVGTQLPNLQVGQVLGSTPIFITRDGDGNQEDITNNAVVVWQTMPCYRFEFHDNPGVDHMALVVNEAVVGRLLAHLQQPQSVCRLP